MAPGRFLLISFILARLSSMALSSQESTAASKLKSSPSLTITAPGGWKTVQKGIELRTIALERSEPSHAIELKILRFDTRWVVPRIIRSSRFQLKGASVKLLAEKSGAIAAINANYFDQKGQALGFLKADAQEVNRAVSKSALFSGVFGIRSFAPFIVHRDEFQSPQADEALQSGPL